MYNRDTFIKGTLKLRIIGTFDNDKKCLFTIYYKILFESIKKREIFFKNNKIEKKVKESE